MLPYSFLTTFLLLHSIVLLFRLQMCQSKHSLPAVFLYNFLSKHHEIVHYKTVHDWVSVIQCSNTHPSTSVCFPPPMSPVSLLLPSTQPVSMAGTFLLSPSLCLCLSESLYLCLYICLSVCLSFSPPPPFGTL